MGPLTGVLTFPVSGPLGGLTWLARQIAENARQQLLDPARIEIALRALERRLEAGELDELAFEAEEARLLEELAEIRAARAALAEGRDPAESDSEAETQAEGTDATREPP